MLRKTFGNITSVHIGDTFEGTVDGIYSMQILIINIHVDSVHLSNSMTMITYNWHNLTSGDTGTETNSVDAFYNNIIKGFSQVSGVY